MVNIEVYHSFLLPSLLHCKSQFEDKVLSSKIMVPSSIFLTQRGLILRHWEDSEYRDKNGEDGVLLFSSVQFNSVTQSCPTLCNPMDPWNSLGQNTGVGSLSLLQGTFPIQGSNPGLPHCRRILYQLSHKGSLRILEWVAYPFSSGSS